MSLREACDTANAQSRRQEMQWPGRGSDVATLSTFDRVDWAIEVHGMAGCSAQAFDRGAVKDDWLRGLSNSAESRSVRSLHAYTLSFCGSWFLFGRGVLLAALRSCRAYPASTRPTINASD